MDGIVARGASFQLERATSLGEHFNASFSAPLHSRHGLERFLRSDTPGVSGRKIYGDAGGRSNGRSSRWPRTQTKRNKRSVVRSSHAGNAPSSPKWKTDSFVRGLPNDWWLSQNRARDHSRSANRGAASTWKRSPFSRSLARGGVSIIF